MKRMKGNILKKLKSIKPIDQYLKNDRVLQINSLDRFIENDVKIIDLYGVAVLQEPEIVDVTDLMRSLEDDLMDLDKLINQEEEKENIGPPPSSFKRKDSCITEKSSSSSEAPRSLISSPEHKALTKSPLSENMSFRRPKLNTGGSLFDPSLLETFQQVVKQHTRVDNEIKFVESDHPPLKIQRKTDVTRDPLSFFEVKCPPGGSESVIFYTTSLRGIRKTFEDCQSIRFLLESFRIYYIERDVSIHAQFKEELWRVLDGESVVVPPRLFIKGRYVGGANEVLVLHEQGKFRPLFDGVRSDKANGQPCDVCAGFRFVVCVHCHGSHKVVVDDGQAFVQNRNRVPAAVVKKSCPDCNENGLIICPICC